MENIKKEVFEKFSIDVFIDELKNKMHKSGLNVDKLEYDVLKDGTYNFIYHIEPDANCQIGRVRFNKRSSKMQIITKNDVVWLQNETMETYIKSIDKWIEYTKQLGKSYEL